MAARICCPYSGSIKAGQLRDRGPASACAVCARLCLGVYRQRASRSFGELGRLRRPCGGMRPSLMSRFSHLGVALLRARPTIEASMIWPLNRPESRLPPAPHQSARTQPRSPVSRRSAHGARQRLAARSRSWARCVRHDVGQPQADPKAHKRQPARGQLQDNLGSLVRQIVADLQDQRLEHQHVIERRPPAFRAVRARHRPLQIRPKQFEIDHRAALQAAVAFGREFASAARQRRKIPPDRASPPPSADPAHQSRTR